MAVNLTLGAVFGSELLGTALLIVLGTGVVANVLLKGSKGFDGGWLLINVGWGFGVLAGVYAAFKSGGHLNPAVTVGILVSGADEYAPGVPVGAASTLAYVSGQFAGAFLGACATYVAYKNHFDAEADDNKKLWVFSTAPQIRNYGWNFLTEVIATFVLVMVVLSLGHTPNTPGPIAAALLVVGIGASLGGPTGYAINPARDLGPRIAHALLVAPRRVTVPIGAAGTAASSSEVLTAAEPVRGRASSDWAYSWVPVAGPLVGAVLAGLLAPVVL
ncbi:MIP/aquaporin family protein [Mycolicibacterium mageritense]|uniref:MIP/aquaporin family protein n=1 Tax=Mycolicibacterium mageritense TaxID=53462 RepID=UPI001E332D55|nr:MIP/aquaporin family protein [Mycolicibacterium mageritense]GJJ21962.1 glycerol transporter [Mycolicibacterium mageritense]